MKMLPWGGLKKLNYAQLLPACVAFLVQHWNGMYPAGWWNSPGQETIILSAPCCAFSILMFWSSSDAGGSSFSLIPVHPRHPTLASLGWLQPPLPQPPGKVQTPFSNSTFGLKDLWGPKCWDFWSAVCFALMGGSQWTVGSSFVGTAQRMWSFFA